MEGEKWKTDNRQVRFIFRPPFFASAFSQRLDVLLRRHDERLAVFASQHRVGRVGV